MRATLPLLVAAVFTAVRRDVVQMQYVLIASAATGAALAWVLFLGCRTPKADEEDIVMRSTLLRDTLSMGVAAMPYAGLAWLVLLIAQWQVSTSEVGTVALALQVWTAVGLLPAHFSTPALPDLSRRFAEGRASFEQAYGRWLVDSTLVGVVAAACAALCIGALFPHLGGVYPKSVVACVVAAIAAGATGPNAVVGHALWATGDRGTGVVLSFARTATIAVLVWLGAYGGAIYICSGILVAVLLQALLCIPFVRWRVVNGATARQ